MLSAGVDFPTFQHQVKIACQAGASGFVAGRTIWQEALETANDGTRQAFLTTTAINRARALANVATHHATPWLARVAGRMPSLTENWHITSNNISPRRASLKIDI